jgi:GNAT superfamily N-acetyltransferase
MLSISQVSSPEDLDAVRALMRDYLAWARATAAVEIHLVERYFSKAPFEAELAALPGVYTPPAGRLLLARRGSFAVGCVALRDLGQGTCEMKRMFVTDCERRTGVGRLLVNHLLEEARAAGYARMRLDTSHYQPPAQRLYESVGFQRIPPYYDVPDELRDWLLYYERDLAA